MAGNYPAAWQTRTQLRDRRRNADAHRPVGRSVVFDIYRTPGPGRPRTRGPSPKPTVLPTARSSPVDGTDAFLLSDYLNAPVEPFRDAVQRAFDQWRAKGEHSPG